MPDINARVRSAFSGSPVDGDVVDELAQHAESAFDALRSEGVSDADAIVRIDALIDGWRKEPMALRRVSRATAVNPPAESRSIVSGAWADAVYGLRLLRAKPGYAAVTIFTIALGVGAVTTLFSVAYGVLLRPLPWGNTERLVRLTETRGGREGRVPGTMMNGSYLAWADAPQTLEGIGFFSGPNQFTLTGAGDATRVAVSRTTPSTIQLLGVTPVRGRIFASNEGARLSNESSVVLISHALWQQRLGLRDDIVGQPLVLDGVQHTIIGVMPREFRFPSADVRAWLAWQPPPVDGPGGTKNGTIMRAIGRLKPGVAPEQAAAEGTARAIAAPDAGPVAMALFGARDPIQITVRDAAEAAAADVRPAILILLIASVLLFLTATANVANMQLARATARHREMTIRAALGAATGRLARQLLIENALVGVLGSIAGLAVTAALVSALPSMLPAGFPRVDAIEIDGRALAFTLLLSAVTTVACGVLPLLHVRKIEIARSLGDSSAASAGAGRSTIAGLRALIVSSQVAVTCVLIIGGVLLARSFNAQITADRGYEPEGLLTASIPFSQSYSVERKEQALTRILDRLRNRPGIQHVAMSTGLPLGSAGGFSVFQFPSPIRGGAEVDVETYRRVVTPGYFGALGIRLRAGRLLSDADTASAPRAVVVNRTFVAKYLENIPIEQAIGLSLGTNAIRAAAGKVEAFIVGVVDDMKQDRPDEPPQSELYVSFAQLPGINHGAQAFLVARTVDDPNNYIEALRSALREEDPTIALDAVMTMDQRVGESLSRPRLYAVLFSGFAVFALAIAGAGLFGVLSQSVSQRSRELAVRTALGASRAAVIATALRQMAIATAAGLVVGLGVSAALSNNLSPFIYGVSPKDWLSFGVAPVLLLVVVVIACVVPARRVAQTDPVVVLREA
ncbi:MAG TPA: ABC transporter permease [Vicinamibacterales bacterium]|nr:ABC transporter permease [Vicinamibacterales bacterium]